jgi:hypothetical protein
VVNGVVLQIVGASEGSALERVAATTQIRVEG